MRSEAYIFLAIACYRLLDSNQDRLARSVAPADQGTLDTGQLVAAMRDTVPALASVDKGRGSDASASGWNMYDLVQKFRTFKASHDRDKVYALVGIAKNVEYARGSLPPISYPPSVDIFDVFWELIDSELCNRHGLVFLEHACGTTRPEGFPSWMPLWEDTTSADSSTACSFGNLEEEWLIRYYADNISRALATMDKKTKTLTLTGIFCSPIVKLGEVFDRDLLELSQIGTRVRWADMVGVQMLEKLDQLLVALKKE